jgi:hypothetical protein
VDTVTIFGLAISTMLRSPSAAPSWHIRASPTCRWRSIVVLGLASVIIGEVLVGTGDRAVDRGHDHGVGVDRLLVAIVLGLNPNDPSDYRCSSSPPVMPDMLRRLGRAGPRGRG